MPTHPASPLASPLPPFAESLLSSTNVPSSIYATPRPRATQTHAHPPPSFDLVSLVLPPLLLFLHLIISTLISLFSYCKNKQPPARNIQISVVLHVSISAQHPFFRVSVNQNLAGKSRPVIKFAGEIAAPAQASCHSDSTCCFYLQSHGLQMCHGQVRCFF